MGQFRVTGLVNMGRSAPHQLGTFVNDSVDRFQISVVIVHYDKLEREMSQLLYSRFSWTC